MKKEIKKMLKIAIAEDDLNDAARLESYLNQYTKEKNIEIQIHHFNNPVGLIDNYTCDYDILFFDIKMPMMNGMDAAKEIRKKDSNVIIIFITSLAQFAIQGYQVDALDFVVKPIEYQEFVLKFERVLLRINKKEKKSLLISTNQNKIRILEEDILYVEAIKHHVIYHTEKENIEVYDSLSRVEKQLDPSLFARCNNCYLVNLKYVSSIKGYIVKVLNEELQISQPKKKDFMRALIAYTEGE